MFNDRRNVMNTASTASQNIRDTAKEAREAVGEVREATSKTSGDMQDDLQKLREDFRRLADQVAEVLANRGNAAWRRAKSSVDDALADAHDKGRDAAGAVREASDHFIEVIDESIKKRPYATLALVAGIAFLFGATWRR
jgi:ElaB/YqjD/DUF883 family membrane-anchored ribosome-binding protein